jgi:hypothetical protein
MPSPTRPVSTEYGVDVREGSFSGAQELAQAIPLPLWRLFSQAQDTCTLPQNWLAREGDQDGQLKGLFPNLYRLLKHFQTFYPCCFALREHRQMPDYELSFEKFGEGARF